MRIRTVKPEFWQNQDLANLPAETRLLAIGLLNYADDDGYFVNNPALIRGAVFPFSEHYRNIPVMLRELSGIGFLTLGKDETGKEYGLVTNFKKHQQINKYRKSTVQGFTVDSGSPTGTLPESYRSPTGGNGMEWNGTGNGMGNGMGNGREGNGNAKPKKKKTEEETLEELVVINDWNQLAAECDLPKVIVPIGEKRLAMLKARIQDGMMSHWEEVKENIKAHNFLRGNNDRGWRIDFTTLVERVDMWRKIAEGKYGRKETDKSDIPF